MKHKLAITITIIALFFLAQLIGLFITKSYLTNEVLPLSIERPELEEGTSYISIIIAIVIATVLAMVMARFRAIKLWKLWFFISIWFMLLIAFGAFLNQYVALILSIIFALLSIFSQNYYLKNFIQLFIYGGLAGLFVPILNLLSISILLIVISVYDMIAVWKTKHMITLAKFQSKSRLFAGIQVKYDKNKEAILGGGDIGFPLLFAGVVLKETNFLNAFIVILFVTLALLGLLIYSKKKKFYPAMPFLTAGCFLGYLITLI